MGFHPYCGGRKTQKQRNAKYVQSLQVHLIYNDTANTTDKQMQDNIAHRLMDMDNLKHNLLKKTHRKHSGL